MSMIDASRNLYLEKSYGEGLYILGKYSYLCIGSNTASIFNQMKI